MVFKKGDCGDEVNAIQTGLISLGYSLGTYGADGKYGDVTETVVKKFQADSKLTSDGDVGPNTMNMLLNKLANQAGIATKAKTLAKQIVSL